MVHKSVYDPLLICYYRRPDPLYRVLADEISRSLPRDCKKGLMLLSGMDLGPNTAAFEVDGADL